LTLGRRHSIAFNEKDDLLFMRTETLPFHANGMRFVALDATGNELANRVYYSVGGGFIVSDEVAADGTRQKPLLPTPPCCPCPLPAATRCWCWRSNTA
jgi:L-serine dehydratase